MNPQELNKLKGFIEFYRMISILTKHCNGHVDSKGNWHFYVSVKDLEKALCCIDPHWRKHIEDYENRVLFDYAGDHPLYDDDDAIHH